MAAHPYTVLEAALGTGLHNSLLEQALTHRSYAYEHGGLPTNERLEFLGDSVLGLVVTDALYLSFPDLPEGQLAKLRAAVVNTRALAGVARGLGLGRWVRLGKGELSTGGRDKNSILADTMEAIIGAVYLERGLAGATVLVRGLIDPLITMAARSDAALDWKTALQELAAAGGHGAPEYAVTHSGPDHARRFEAAALVAGQILGTGVGGSKKEAEQGAARTAWRSLSEVPPVPGQESAGTVSPGRQPSGAAPPAARSLPVVVSPVGGDA